MTKLPNRYLLSFLFCFVLEISDVSAGSQFKVRINEKGTHFNEKVKISEKQNIVSFKVPKHNDANRSDIVNDFNLNLTITRLPDVGICHVKPLERGMPNPKEMKADMNFIKKERARLKGMNMVFSSTEWTIDRRIKRKDLSPSIAKFCAGLPVYLLKEVIDDDLVTVQRNDTVGRRKRQNGPFPLCPGSYLNKPCHPGEWIVNCAFVLSWSSVYWMKCKLPVKKITNIYINQCGFTHSWSSVICCVPHCPPGKG